MTPEQIRSQINLYGNRPFGNPDHAEILLRQLEEEPEGILLRSTMRGHITTSALIVNRPRTKILLINHKTLEKWLQPGGHYEGDDLLSGSAWREAVEETGVKLIQTYDICPFDIDTHAIPANLKKNEGDHFHHDLVYLAVGEEEETTPQLTEVHSARWIALDEARKINWRLERMIYNLETIT